MPSNRQRSTVSCARPSTNPRPIYLDYAAATPVRSAVATAMAPFAAAQFANPASLTRPGVAAREAVETARQTIARVLGCQSDEVIFTGSGTESTNLALQGCLRALPVGSHLLVSAIEHHAVLEPAAALAREGYTVEQVPVTPAGLVTVEAVLARLRPTTRLVSVMYANNEIGTIQPVAALARGLRRVNSQRAAAQLPAVLLHTDACQAPGYLPMNVRALGVDALSLNAAKIGGPKGSGLLYLRRGLPLKPLVYGGGQEAGRRSGTEAVAQIVGLAQALAIATAEQATEVPRVSGLRDELLAGLCRGIPGLMVHGDLAARLPNNLSFAIPGIDADALVLYLDHDGVYVGTGAACSNTALEPSHVLTALGVSPSLALATVRVSLGAVTTAAEVRAATKRIIARVAWLRRQGWLAGGD